MKIRVYYEDTDAGGIVYHTNYIKYCERARSEAFFAQGLKPLEGDASGFVVSSLNAKFSSPAYLGDTLEVKTEMLALKKSYIVLLQQIYRDDTKIFSMEIRLAFVADGKIARIPEKFISLLESFSN